MRAENTMEHFDDLSGPVICKRIIDGLGFLSGLNNPFHAEQGELLGHCALANAKCFTHFANTALTANELTNDQQALFVCQRAQKLCCVTG